MNQESHPSRPANGPARTANSLNHIDFEQWHNELKLFVDETGAELHAVAGVLSAALSQEDSLSTEFVSGNESASLSDSSKSMETSKSPSLTNDEDPFADIQNRITKRLQQARNSNSSDTTQHPGGSGSNPSDPKRCPFDQQRSTASHQSLDADDY